MHGEELQYMKEAYDANYLLSCLLNDDGTMCPQESGSTTASYTIEPEKSCPTVILELEML